MENYIDFLDKLHGIKCTEYGVLKGRKKFSIHVPMTVMMYGSQNQNFIIRKNEFTKYLYVKDGCRVYFSDADILTMLLQVKNKNTIDSLVYQLKQLYWSKGKAKFTIEFDEQCYTVNGLEEIMDNQILTNPQDIPITFGELLILINIILAKDMASVPLWPFKPNFLKHTIAKYISLLMFYYYNNLDAKKYLDDMGFDTSTNIYKNYDTKQKREEKTKYFNNFKVFEKTKLLC